MEGGDVSEADVVNGQLRHVTNAQFLIARLAQQEDEVGIDVVDGQLGDLTHGDCLQARGT